MYILSLNIHFFKKLSTLTVEKLAANLFPTLNSVSSSLISRLTRGFWVCSLMFPW